MRVYVLSRLDYTYYKNENQDPIIAFETFCNCATKTLKKTSPKVLTRSPQCACNAATISLSLQCKVNLLASCWKSCKNYVKENLISPTLISRPLADYTDCE